MRNLLIIALALVCFACKKESFTNSASALLRTTADTLHFDTVFTSTGSITQLVKIINDNNKGIHVSSVRLAGGNNSPFRINVDGVAGPEVNDIDISGNDSIYVFVTVSIQPNSANLPFIVRDSIEINYNGNTKYVQLDAYGRNAHFMRDHKITGSEIWNNDLPYVILGRLTVDTNAILTINQGCRIYMHADAPFIVNGTLVVNGEHHDSSRVVFAGDRLDEPYRHYPASYPGIVFTNVSRNNLLNYAIIKNAYQGIVVTDPSPGTKLTLNETIIDNAYDAGILGINTSIKARNVLISNCGKNILLVNGGDYDFNHCTAASFSSNLGVHRDPVLLLTNYLLQESNDLNAVFRNCIFWGENNGLVPDEVKVLKQGNNAFNVIFDQVLWRVQNPPLNIIANGIINNQDPKFDSINTSEKFYSFQLKHDSPAIDKGVNTGVSTDLNGRPRPVGLPDLGAYEKQ
ncbi:MAG TPA: choice-of-anchor Q domain-containing protein [Flavisolibacter sp.]